MLHTNCGSTHTWSARWYFFPNSRDHEIYLTRSSGKNVAQTVFEKRSKTWKSVKLIGPRLHLHSHKNRPVRIFSIHTGGRVGTTMVPTGCSPWREYTSKCSLLNSHFTCMNKLSWKKRQHNTHTATRPGFFFYISMMMPCNVDLRNVRQRCVWKEVDAFKVVHCEPPHHLKKRPIRWIPSNLNGVSPMCRAPLLIHKGSNM